MDVLRSSRRTPLIIAFALALLVLPRPAWAQRELYWANLDVDATLTADGALRISETHTMVFTGDWNGGERVFNLRPRQSIALIELARSVNGGWRALTEDDRLDDRDEYAWTDRQTLRWRSRLPLTPPSATCPFAIDCVTSSVAFSSRVVAPTSSITIFCFPIERAPFCSSRSSSGSTRPGRRSARSARRTRRSASPRATAMC